MGNSNSLASTEDNVNFQKLDKYFSKSVSGAWLKKEPVQLNDYIEPLMKLYVNSNSIESSIVVPNDENFKQHLLLMLNYHFNNILGNSVKNGYSLGFLMPKIVGQSNLLNSMYVCYLQSHLQDTCRIRWKIVYNSSIDGTAWSQFIYALVKCPCRSLIIIKSEGKTFGGHMATPWSNNPGQFVGNSDNFLFSLNGENSAIYKSTFYNENYAYLSLNSASCTNGLGFGGQLDYFGLYLKDDFTGSSFAKPISTTYGSPQFTNNEKFVIDHLEVVIVEEFDPEDYKIRNPSWQAFGRQDNMEFLEMAGFEMHSKNLQHNIPDKGEDR
eukprot:NODE_280_length_11906_cov_0.405268.p5 type:complete len:325 gc:universal NODE_280_length_11906_cov_0.405268:5685-4711(-)